MRPALYTSAKKSLAQFLPGGIVDIFGLMRHFDRHGALHEGIEGFVYHAHGTATDTTLDFVLGDLG